ncbi:MAG: hypothetical protein GC156_15435 [Actinomycetales bacterium]|nr:hypothetical protein [Actinomycetales bacterium]
MSSSALHGSPGKVVESVSAGAAVVVTRYSGTQAYVLSPELAETLAVKAAGLDALRRDLEAVRPFLDAAMRAGVSPLEVLDQVLHDSDEGTVAVDFAGLGRLMSRVPVALVAGEDGGPLARVELVGVSAVGTGADDDDYSAFDDE